VVAIATSAGLCKATKARGEIALEERKNRDAEREQNGGAARRQPSPVAGDLTETSSFNSGRERTAPWERGSTGEGEWSGGE
jgi:hypothetical protein